jgi:hypothetical protein
MHLWSDCGYREAIPLLIATLEEADKYWATQKLDPGWWNADDNPERRSERRRVYAETYHAAFALMEFRDPRAREVIEFTLRRWEGIPMDNPQIVETCREALQILEPRPGTPQMTR